MANTSPTERLPGLYDKTSDHPLAQILLGEVVGVHWLGDKVVLYYTGGRRAALAVDIDGEIVVADYQGKMH